MEITTILKLGSKIPLVKAFFKMSYDRYMYLKNLEKSSYYIIYSILAQRLNLDLNITDILKNFKGNEKEYINNLLKKTGVKKDFDFKLTEKKMVKMHSLLTEKNKVIKYENFLSKSVCFKIRFCFYNYSLLKELTEIVSNEEDSIFNYKKNNYDQHKEKTVRKRKDNKKSKKTIESVINRPPSRFIADDVDFILNEMGKCNPNIYWEENTRYQILIDLIAKIAISNKVENKKHIKKVARYYINLLLIEDKKEFIIHFLYNVSKNKNNTSADMENILDVIEEFGKIFNENIKSHKVIGYTYKQLKNKSFGRCMDKYKRIISLNNWAKLALVDN